ncbi:hypothetical protein METP3_03766 [Methanosarcinales archaeon]|nr:hypothetical protein METP3_03766 [Methanosarcinales archaeon]
MHVREVPLSLLRDEEVRDTDNINQNIICKGFGYNFTCDEYSSDIQKEWLLVPTKSGISKSIEWRFDFQTNIDMIKPRWYAAHPLVCLRDSGSQTDIRPDTSPTIANNFTEISPEIKELSESNALFNDVLITALSEISFLLDKEMDKLNYQIKVKIEEDLEIPEWKETLISIKVPKRNPEDLIRLWKLVEERVRKRIESIKKENEEEINKINENLAIFIEELD